MQVAQCHPCLTTKLFVQEIISEKYLKYPIVNINLYLQM